MTENQRLLVSEHIGLAHKYARKASQRISRITEDEILSASYIGLIQAALAFEEEKGFKFSTYAWSKMRRAVQEEVIFADLIPVPDYMIWKRSRKIFKDGKIPTALQMVDSVSFDKYGEQISTGIYALGTFDEDIIDRLSKEQEIENLYTALTMIPKTEADVVRATMLQGYTLEEYAKQIGKSHQTVWIHKKEGIEKLKQLLSNGLALIEWPVKCSKCKSRKAAKEFHWDNRGQKRRARCMACVSSNRRAQKKAATQKMKEYRATPKGYLVTRINSLKSKLRRAVNPEDRTILRERIDSYTKSLEQLKNQKEQSV